MNLALLGADAQSLQLADAAAAAGHVISWQGDLAGVEASAHPWLNGVDRAADWEDLLDPAVAAAVIVGRGAAGPDLRARQVQELVRQGRPLLVTHPAFDSVLTYFEIDMARSESGAAVQHYNPLLHSPHLAEAEAWIRGGHPSLGAVEQVVCTRSVADRSRQRVLWHFARDVEMLARVAGRFDRIGAHGAASDATSYGALSVQLLGLNNVPVRWAVEPPIGPEGMTLTLVCDAGRISLVLDGEDRVVHLLLNRGGESSPLVATSTEPAVLAIERFVAAVAGEANAESTWPDALQSMELADSIEISLRRGRMIEIHQQQLTEQLAFKGTMAAAGCGVLLVLVPLMLLAGWLAGLFGIPVAKYWPHALLAALTLFLAVQVLPKLLYPAAK